MSTPPRLFFNKTILRKVAYGLIVFAIFAIFQDKLGIKIDGTVVAIVGLAILLYILPELPNISKFKYGDVELEFEKEVDKFEKLMIVEEASKTIIPEERMKSKSLNWQHYYSEYNVILSSSSSNIEKILRASQLVELMISEAGKDFGLTDKVNLKSPHSVMKALEQHQFITKEEFMLFNEFYSLRNRIIHGAIKEIDDFLTTRILDLLWRLIRIFG